MEIKVEAIENGYLLTWYTLAADGRYDTYKEFVRTTDEVAENVRKLLELNG